MILDTPLAKVGGKGLFMPKGWSHALLENLFTMSPVHSASKDVPVEIPQGLGLVTIVSVKILT